MRASLTYDRLFVIGSVDGIPLPSSFNLDMIEFLLSPLYFFFIMRMFADLVLTLRQPPYEPLLLLYKNVLCAFPWPINSYPFFFLVTQKWRRRWFVLKHSGELPGQYFLEYYTDRTCRKLKGKIDLDQCEQVITHYIAFLFFVKNHF